MKYNRTRIERVKAIQLSWRLDKENFILAAKANHIPTEKSGLWFIYKKSYLTDKIVDYRGQERTLPASEITYLIRMTMETIHLDPPGDIVMEDTIFELETHYNFIKRASGNVLVTGLGLGCAIRGLLINPKVKHITCIEKSGDVLKLIQPYMPKDKLTIIQADALEWTKKNKFSFDCAWHDLWTDRCTGEPHLDIWHTELIKNCIKKVKNQGAWRFNRSFKRVLMNKGIRLIA